MKHIYITMVQLPTIANKMTQLLTGFEYSHSSLSFDNDLSTLYSFQIKNHKVFLVGGFVQETHDMYFHHKNVSLKERVFKIPVSDEEYDKIKSFIHKLQNDPEYTFNYVSALFMFFTGGVKSYKAFHCVEFMSEVISLIDKIELPVPAHKMRPKDLYGVLKPYMIRDGIIYGKDFDFKEDQFTKTIKPWVALKKSLYSVREAICRAVYGRVSKNFNYRNINFYEADVIDIDTPHI